jgi:thiamine pyrophosphokinase
LTLALVVPDAPLPPPGLLGPLRKAADLVVAADGGADRALKAGLPLDWIVGDLDSVSAQALRRMPPGRVVADRDPDSTDLEKVMRFLHKRRVDSVVIVGAIGERLDHTLATLAIVAAWHSRMDVRIVDSHFTTLVVDPAFEFESPIGTMVSLVAPSGATGVTTRGLRFALRNKRLTFSPLGIHNEVVGNPVRVEVKRGPLFLMRSHHVRPHG